MSKLANAKIKIITTQAMLFNSEQKNKQLEGQLEEKRKFIFIDGVYWIDGDSTAFCPKSFEDENKKYICSPVKECTWV